MNFVVKRHTWRETFSPEVSHASFNRINKVRQAQLRENICFDSLWVPRGGGVETKIFKIRRLCLRKEKSSAPGKWNRLLQFEAQTSNIFCLRLAWNNLFFHVFFFPIYKSGYIFVQKKNLCVADKLCSKSWSDSLGKRQSPRQREMLHVRNAFTARRPDGLGFLCGFTGNCPTCRNKYPEIKCGFAGDEVRTRKSAPWNLTTQPLVTSNSLTCGRHEFLECNQWCNHWVQIFVRPQTPDKKKRLREACVSTLNFNACLRVCFFLFGRQHNKNDFFLKIRLEDEFVVRQRHTGARFAFKALNTNGCFLRNLLHQVTFPRNQVQNGRAGRGYEA